MPARRLDSHNPLDVKVVIHDAEGKFLAGGGKEWFFTPNRSSALIFDFDADHVEEQLAALRTACGLELTPEPVPLEEIYQPCDRCKEFFIPHMVFFDGKRFLCAECRRLAAKPRRQTGA